MPEGAEAPVRRVASGLRSGSALLQGGPTTPTGTNVFFNADMVRLANDKTLHS
jgi:hypothetical protein